MRTEIARHSRTYIVLPLVLGSGERLPLVVDHVTWIPPRVAMRWAVRYRRNKVQSSTLTENLRVLARIYAWAWEIGEFDLDNFLLTGHSLHARQVESLAECLRRGSHTTLPPGRAETKDHPEDQVSAGSYDHALAIAEKFFKWALDETNCGGTFTRTLEQLAATRSQLNFLFDSLRIGAPPAERIPPLDLQEVQSIRQAIGPQRNAGGAWVFPSGIFSEQTQLRNWLMFETCLGLGLRRGELLKLRLDALPRGADDRIRILRRPDDPYDSRTKEPAVKTAERILSVPRRLLNALHSYLALPPPRGRVRGKSPYLFVANSGTPISLDTADDVIALIGRYSGLPLSWHRLRHTWAEARARILLDESDGVEQLQYLGGWTNPHSPERYIRRAREEKATEKFRAYQQALYQQETLPWEGF